MERLLLAFERQVEGLDGSCNVVVRQDEAGTTNAEFMDPDTVPQLVDRPEVKAIAAEVRARLVTGDGIPVAASAQS